MYFPIGWPKTLRPPFSQETDHLSGQHASNSSLGSSSNHNHGYNESFNAFSKYAKQVAANTDRSLFAILTPRSLHVWWHRPSVELVRHTRSQQSIDFMGENQMAVWRPDSSMIVVATSRNYLLFYSASLKPGAESGIEGTLLEQTDAETSSGLRRQSAELYSSQKLPAIWLQFLHSTQIRAGISCIMAAEEEVVIGTKCGEICGVNWDGSIDDGFMWRLNDAPSTPAADSSRPPPFKESSPSPSSSLSSRGSTLATDTPEGSVADSGLESASLPPQSCCVIDMKYSSMIGGFSLVFDSGRAAYLPIYQITNGVQPTNDGSSTSTASTSSSTWSKLQFVADVDQAVSTAISHKYQLMAFGLKNSQGILCCLESTTNSCSVLKTHTLTLSSCAFQDISQSVGPMTCLLWSPDSSVLATAWQNGGYALWSVFGSLLSCSLSWDSGLYEAQKFSPFRVLSLAWAKEGYNLWMVTKKNRIRKASSNDSKGAHSESSDSWMAVTDGVSIVSIAKSVLASNPSSACSSEIVVFISEDRLYVGVGALSSFQKTKASTQASASDDPAECDTLPSTNASNGVIEWVQHPIEAGNHHWIVIPLPSSYMEANWPVRYAAIDTDGQHIAIAGRTGLAHYSLSKRKWKMFGNETQERDLEVCGGLLWWADHIVLGCYNVVEEGFEIRAYPENSKLDNNFVRKTKVPAEVLLLSAFEQRLLALLADGTLHLFAFMRNERNPSSPLHIVKVNEIIVSNLMVPAECITCLVLTNLHVESGRKDESILMNVCGRLFLLEKESQEKIVHPTQQSKRPNASDQVLVFKAVSTLASGVENVWVSPNYSGVKSDRPHLTESLWLSCGSEGMGVWLPLFPCGVAESPEKPRPARAHTFISKRIMLPIKTRIYPLSVLFRDAVVLGAESETNDLAGSNPYSYPFCVVSRTSQVYLHHILRELLRRNLGYHAWEIASSCQSLPYFPHSLELLLHEVLEEEATSSHPIPDALLPRVVDFIREFPVFLMTFVHCARKTEPALWPHLFECVGSPQNLFRECLKNNQLQTAASYLIIIRNLEKASVTKQLANQLLDLALVGGYHQLVQDLFRFLNALESHESQVASPETASHPSPHAMNHPLSGLVTKNATPFIPSNSAPTGSAQGLVPGSAAGVSTSEALKSMKLLSKPSRDRHNSLSKSHEKS